MLEPAEDEVREDVREVGVARPKVCSVAKLVPDEKDNFFGNVAAGVQVASVLRGAFERAEVKEDIGLWLLAAWKCS